MQQAQCRNICCVVFDKGGKRRKGVSNRRMGRYSGKCSRNLTRMLSHHYCCILKLIETRIKEATQIRRHQPQLNSDSDRDLSNMYNSSKNRHYGPYAQKVRPGLKLDLV